MPKPVEFNEFYKIIKKGKERGVDINSDLNNLMNDYNVVFLPETQEIKLDFEKIKIVNDQDNIGYKGFFLDISGQDIFISSKKGKFYKLNDCKCYPKPDSHIDLVSAGQSKEGLDFVEIYGF